MKRRIEDYVIRFSNAIDDTTCDNTLKVLESPEGWEKHQYYNYDSNPTDNGNEELSINPREDFEEREVIMKIIWECLHKYLTQLDFYWFHEWNAYSGVRFNRYEVGQRMQTHCDHIYTLFDGKDKGIPILTILGVLNDDYEGGELTLWENPETKIEMNKGDIIIFPSNFLYPHKVDPVTKGTRTSFVSWAW